jgi:hypothetical protein
MPKANSLKISDVFTISGSQISEIYVKNKMMVHFQECQNPAIPHTIFFIAPTCSIGISPDGLYNRLNNAGRLILLNQNAIQFASAPFIRIDNEKPVMLTAKNPSSVEGPDDVPALKNYYHPPYPKSKLQFLSLRP